MITIEPEPVQKHRHAIENKGPNSYWVHRFKNSNQAISSRFSRVVYFARSQQDAEEYVKVMEKSVELT